MQFDPYSNDSEDWQVKSADLQRTFIVTLILVSYGILYGFLREIWKFAKFVYMVMVKDSRGNNNGAP